MNLKEFPSAKNGGWSGTSQQMIMFAPESSWRPPGQILKPARVLALDIESRDEKLKTRGPGFKYGEGVAVGIAIATEEGAQYLPFAHLGGDNLDKTVVLRAVQELLNAAEEVIMANATYDLGWLDHLGLKVRGIVRCVQVAEALLDEDRRSYSLDSLSLAYLKRKKNEDALKEAAAAFGLDPKKDMWRLPARYVGTYAEFDALNTLEIYEAQKPLLKDDGLWKLWNLECKITKICAKMTKRGVPVDLEAAEKLNEQLARKEQELLRKFSFDIWSSQQIGSWIEEKLGITVPRTEKENYSVDKNWLAVQDHDDLKKLNELRGLQRLRKVFIEDGILNGHYKGRIHASFLQVARDEGGTRSGRFACNRPNLQQVPKRSDLGKMIRKLYIAEPGALWAKADYSSQEPRLQVHYALQLGLPGAEQIRESFIEGVKLYTFLEQSTGLSYDICKSLVLGIGYGMGLAKLADILGVSVEEAKKIRDQFNEKAPFISMLFDRCMAKAQQRGFIRTILNRKARFNWWTTGRDQEPVKGFTKAAKMFGTNRLERAFVSKALNRLIQGGAADQTKLAMALCDEAGIDLRLPVHDELNSMVATEEEARLQCEIMEHAIELRLPSVADLDLGKTWC